MKEEQDILMFDIAKAEADKMAMKVKRSELYAAVKAKTLEYKLAIEKKIREDNNFGVFISQLSVVFYDYEVYFKMAEADNSTAAIIKFHFLQQEDLNEFRTDKKEYAIEKNIGAHDIYRFESPGFDMNLLEQYNIDIVEYATVFKYFATQFQQRGELVQMIKGFCEERSFDLKTIHDFESEMHMLDYKIKDYYTALYTKELLDIDYIKEGNIIVVHLKKTDFVLFKSYVLEKAKNIQIKLGCADSLKFAFGSGPSVGKKICFLRLEDNIPAINNIKTRIHLFDILLNHKLNGDKIDIYTDKEYNDYCMLIQSEANNIRESDNEYYKAISDKYNDICLSEK